MGVSQKEYKVVRVKPVLDFLDGFRVSSSDKRVLTETGKNSAIGKRFENDLITEMGIFVTIDRT